VRFGSPGYSNRLFPDRVPVFLFERDPLLRIALMSLHWSVISAQTRSAFVATQN